MNVHLPYCTEYALMWRNCFSYNRHLHLFLTKILSQATFDKHCKLMKPSKVTRMYSQKSVIRSAEKIIGIGLPSMHAIYNDRAKKRTLSIIKDDFHPAYNLFNFLRSGKRLRTFYGNKRFLNSFYPSAIRIFNTLSS